MVKINRSNRLGDNIFNTINIFFMLIVLFSTLYPFWEQVVLSLSGGAAIYSKSIKLYPVNFSLDVYKNLLKYNMIWIGYLNSFKRTVIATSTSLLLSALVSYPLSKEDFPLNKTITTFILFTMLFSAGMIPQYLLIKNLGLMNKMGALVLPGILNAWNIFIIRNFYKSIPKSLEESALLDGAGWLRIWWCIIIPLSKPVLATVGLWIMVGHWNAWLDALIYIQDMNKTVLPVILRNVLMKSDLSKVENLISSTSNKTIGDMKSIKAGIIIMSIVPMLMIYPFIQKYFAKGIMIGAVKG